MLCRSKIALYLCQQFYIRLVIFIFLLFNLSLVHSSQKNSLTEASDLKLHIELIIKHIIYQSVLKVKTRYTLFNHTELDSDFLTLRFSEHDAQSLLILQMHLKSPNAPIQNLQFIKWIYGTSKQIQLDRQLITEKLDSPSIRKLSKISLYWNSHWIQRVASFAFRWSSPITILFIKSLTSSYDIHITTSISLDAIDVISTKYKEDIDRLIEQTKDHFDKVELE